MSREDPFFRLRLPEELRDKIKILAANARRSMTAEIVARLEESVANELELGVKLPRTVSPEVEAVISEQIAALERALSSKLEERLESELKARLDSLRDGKGERGI